MGKHRMKRRTRNWPELCMELWTGLMIGLYLLFPGFRGYSALSPAKTVLFYVLAGLLLVLGAALLLRDLRQKRGLAMGPAQAADNCPVVPVAQFDMRMSMCADFAAAIHHICPDVTVLLFQAAVYHKREKGHFDTVFPAEIRVICNPFPAVFVAVIHGDGNLRAVPVTVAQHKIVQKLRVPLRACDGKRKQYAQAQDQRRSFFQHSHSSSR